MAALEHCELCPRRCRADRLHGELGKCRTGRQAILSSYAPHFGEEPPLVGSHGSGAIFFAYCNLRCIYCQNYTISQQGEGIPAGAAQIAQAMLSLQAIGCHNINLVTPTHVVPQILEALLLAAARGLELPLVYNCGGYESLETLALLDGVIDIYMPDMKYSSESLAREYSGVPDYPAVNRSAVKEMHRQVGDLRVDDDGVATRGLLVRHLVLPHGLAGTDGVARFLAEEVSPGTYLNVMPQYRPAYLAGNAPLLSRTLAGDEFQQAIGAAARCGLRQPDM